MAVSDVFHTLGRCCPPLSWCGPLPREHRKRGFPQSAARRPRESLHRVLDAFQKPKVIFGQPVRPRAFAQQRDVPQGRLSIVLRPLSQIRDRPDHPAIVVLGFDLDMAVSAPGHPFCRVQAHEISSRDAVEHAPDLRVRVRVQVRRGSPAFWPAFQIEPHAVSLDATGTVLQWLYAAAHPEGSVMHVGAIREIPDLILRPSEQASAPATVIAAREEPRFRSDAAQLEPQYPWWERSLRHSAPDARSRPRQIGIASNVSI